MEGTESGRLLRLVGFHAAEHVVENADGVQHVRPLVEHHALGALGHRGIGHLGAGVAALADERVENVRSPDDRRVCGFAEPEDLLLDLCQPAEANLDGEVAAGGAIVSMSATSFAVNGSSWSGVSGKFSPCCCGAGPSTPPE
jgi:hypothetical protein